MAKAGDVVKHKTKDLQIKVSSTHHLHLNGYDQNGHYHAGLRQDAFVPIEVWSEPEECMVHQDHSQYWKGCVYERTVASVMVSTAGGGPQDTKTTKTYRIRLDNKPKAVNVSDLKGTVEMVDGKPDWSTYKES